MRRRIESPRSSMGRCMWGLAPASRLRAARRRSHQLVDGPGRPGTADGLGCERANLATHLRRRHDPSEYARGEAKPQIPLARRQGPQPALEPELAQIGQSIGPEGVDSGRGRNPTLSADHRFRGFRYSRVSRI